MTDELIEQPAEDLAAALEASRNAVVAVRIKRDRITVEGDQAAQYLQGQLSQNVERMAIGDTARTLLLQPQGKIDSWMRVYRQGENTFWLDTDVGYGASALERLERFKLRTKADLKLASVEIVALRGPDYQRFELPKSVTVVDANWASIVGVDVFPNGESFEEEFPSSDAVALGPPETLEVLRIQAGQPAMGSELGPSTIPAAAHVVDESVDFTKGCYVGQELVARIDSRGSNTPKRLCGIAASTTGEVTLGSSILGTDGTELGELTSIIQLGDGTSIGLAYIKRAVEVPCAAQVAQADGVLADLEVSIVPVS